MTRKWLVPFLRRVVFSGMLLGLPLHSWGKPQNPPAVPSVSSPSATSDDIRDIRGPVHIPYSWLWIVYAAGGLAALALLILAYRAWKRRPRTILKLPHETALEQLQQALAWMTPEQAREFSIAVSGAVRAYIEARFHARAAHRTTEEFLHDLLNDPTSPLSRHSGSLNDFLTHCDLAKFAKWSLSTSEMESMHASAKKFVLETKPREPSEKAGPSTPKEHPVESSVKTARPSAPPVVPQEPIQGA